MLRSNGNRRKVLIFGKVYDKSYVLALLFLMPSFFLRFTYGSDNAHLDLSLGWLQIFIGLYVFVRVWNKADSQRALLVHLVIFSIIAVHFLFLTAFGKVGSAYAEPLFSVFIPVYLYLSLSLLAAHNYITLSPKIVEQVFCKLSLISIIIALAAFLLYYFLGISLLVNHYGGSSWVRAHAFMTEPSGMAAPVAYIISLGILNSNYRMFLIGVVGILVTQSAVVILIAAFLLAVSIYIKTKNKAYYASAIVLLIVSFSSLFFTYDCMSEIEASPVIHKSVCGIKALWELDNQILINANPRLATALMAIDMLSGNDGWLFGFGLNSSAVLMRMNYDDIENSLFVSMILFFGMWGGLFYIFTAYLGLRKAQHYGASFVLFYISLLVSVTLNSAGGFYVYLMYFFVLYILMIHKTDRYRRENPLTKVQNNYVPSNISQ